MLDDEQLEGKYFILSSHLSTNGLNNYFDFFFKAVKQRKLTLISLLARHTPSLSEDSFVSVHGGTGRPAW